MTNEIELVFQNEKHPKKHGDLFKRYGVAVRERQQIVEHEAYGRHTVISPHQFALYEAAIKASYISHEFRKRIGPKTNERFHVIDMTQPGHYQQIARKDGFTLPTFDPDWTEAKWKQAAEDYSYIAGQFRKMVGKDARSGEEIDLYYACLD